MMESMKVIYDQIQQLDTNLNVVDEPLIRAAQNVIEGHDMRLVLLILSKIENRRYQLSKTIINKKDKKVPGPVDSPVSCNK